MRILNDLHPATRNLVRIAYLALILILAGFAYATWRQLQSLRSAPVALPNFGFYVVDMPVKSSLVHANGSWISSAGAQPGDALQTTALQCTRSKMQCVESTAIVSVKDGSYLETVPAVYEVDQWNDDKLVTKALNSNCSARVLTVSMIDRSAVNEVTLLPGNAQCKDPPRTLRLDHGSKSRIVAPPAKK
ncbi:MAG: hypothetical protein JNN20_13645 [Betaproteobacteria bacterium]|nr:hypothetical protein [Betaproteobacteria bacterium]